MTDEQGLALARLMRDRPGGLVSIRRKPFALLEGYVEVSFYGGFSSTGGFECGIAPDGRVSS